MCLGFYGGFSVAAPVAARWPDETIEIEAIPAEAEEDWPPERESRALAGGTSGLPSGRMMSCKRRNGRLGVRYFDIPAASPPVIPGALMVRAMTLGYSSMDRVLMRKDRAVTIEHLCGRSTGSSDEVCRLDVAVLAWGPRRGRDR